jgi:hypothetical protein
MSKKYNYPIGSVSSGTMRSEDLLDAFTYTLKQLDEPRFTAFSDDNQDAFNDESPDYQESLDQAVEELFDILNEYAGPYFYFGAHEGDGADYGFWFCEESFNQATSR